MGYALQKNGRICIPERDHSIIATPKPSLGTETNHRDQVVHAGVIGFIRYEKAMKKLSEV